MNAQQLKQEREEAAREQIRLEIGNNQELYDIAGDAVRRSVNYIQAASRFVRDIGKMRTIEGNFKYKKTRVLLVLPYWFEPELLNTK